VEVTGERDLVAGLRLVPIDPRISDVRLHFDIEVLLHSLLTRFVRLGVITPAERNVLGVPQRGVWLELALVLARLHPAIVSSIVTDTNRLPQLLSLRRREPHTMIDEVAAELLVELLPVQVDLVAERFERLGKPVDLRQRLLLRHG